MRFIHIFCSPTKSFNKRSQTLRSKCLLQLSNGTQFEGDLIGAPLISSGEMVFTTGMVGYSEAITDPSYFGQILVFSYPLIGNYGIPKLPLDNSWPIPRGFESNKAHTSGVIISLDSTDCYHWNSFESLDKWLEAQGIPGIVGLDTRHLVQTIRNNKNLLGRIVPSEPTGELSRGSFTPNLENFYDPSQHEILGFVTKGQPATLTQGTPKIGVIDCGVKANILRQLEASGAGIELIPWDQDFSKFKVDGWLISNGPGDPTKTGQLIEKVKTLIKEDRPILGICLGHQILSLAAGAKTHRMEYGHRSHNQPVRLMETRRGFITSQNHGYVVEETSIPKNWQVWFKNANDSTVEGIRHSSLPLRSVQFHPEAAGGPRDTGWILQEFIDEVRNRCQSSKS